MAWQSRQRRAPRGAPHLPTVASLPVLPTVHLYEHIHEHHHFLYRPPPPPESPESPDPPETQERQESQEPEVSESHLAERTKRPKARAQRRRQSQDSRHSRDSEPEMAIPRIVVEQVPDKPSSEVSHAEEASDVAVARTDSAGSFPRWKKDARPKPKAMPKPTMDYLAVVTERSREQLDSRGSMASSRCVSRGSSPAKTKGAKAQQDPVEEDPLALRLKLMQAESVWSDLRRDLRRHLRELPDSSKSKAKQKLMGQMVTGTSKDRARLEHTKAKEHEQSRELVRHVEEELKACSRSRHRVQRMQELLRRRGVHFFR